MPELVTKGALLKCSFGGPPTPLKPTPVGMVTASGQDVATVMDFAPGVNISPFGMCMSLSNPQVAAATAAALGVLTPQPCVPVTTGPWKPGATTVTIRGMKALTKPSICNCAWGGIITIQFPGQLQSTAV